MLDEGVSLERQRLGWGDPDFGDATVVVAPDAATRKDLLLSADPATVHILSGFNAYEGVVQTHQLVRAHRLRHLILSESLDPRGLKGRLRMTLRRLQARQLRPQPDGVLAIGSLASQQLARMFSSVTPIPFAYFPEVQPPALTQRPSTEALRVAYVGGFHHWKAPDRLLTALKDVRRPWTLEVAGDGSGRARLMAQADELGLGSQVTWHGPVANAGAVQLMARSDLLVVPSRYDGWGAVVNESLLVGTPVLCTPAVGAHQLVAAPADGAVAESVPALTAHIDTAPCQSSTARAKLSVRSTARFSAARGAEYLAGVVSSVAEGHAPPPAPWLPAPE